MLQHPKQTVCFKGKKDSSPPEALFLHETSLILHNSSKSSGRGYKTLFHFSVKITLRTSLLCRPLVVQTNNRHKMDTIEYIILLLFDW